jgi:hypothetical protein
LKAHITDFLGGGKTIATRWWGATPVGTSPSPKNLFRSTLIESLALGVEYEPITLVGNRIPKTPRVKPLI